MTFLVLVILTTNHFSFNNEISLALFGSGLPEHAQNLLPVELQQSVCTAF
jgi:hypothetical protein